MGGPNAPLGVEDSVPHRGRLRQPSREDRHTFSRLPRSGHLVVIAAFHKPMPYVAVAGISTCEDNVANDGSAQDTGRSPTTCRMGQFDPLLPFRIGPATGGEHQKATVGATGRMRQEAGVPTACLWPKVECREGSEWLSSATTDRNRTTLSLA